MVALGGWLFMGVACSSTPDGVYSEGEMEDILYDYYKAKAMGENLSPEEQYKANLYIQSVYKKYGTTEAEFDSSLVWYTTNPDVFAKVYKKLQTRFDDDLKALGSAGAGNALAGNSAALSGDTTELWQGEKFALLSNTLFSRRLNFSLKADSSYHEEDRFAWTFTVHLPGSGAGGGNMSAALCIRYDNDSVAGTTQTVYSSGPVTLMLDAIPARKIKSVFGFVYKGGGELGDTSTPYSVALLDRFSLLRQHKQLPKIDDKSSHKADSAKKDSSAGLAPLLRLKQRQNK